MALSPYSIARPLLLRMDAETAHGMTLKLLHAGLVPKAPAANNEALRITLWDRAFPNPVGLAAGFDKNAAVIGPMLAMGFRFVEAGTVTPKPQRGNPRPRVFRDPDSGSIINAMGFPNEGVNAFRGNLERFLERRPRPAGLIGVNIGMNKSQTDPAKDYRLLVRALGPLADYLTVNISSPNTPGLRNLQQKENLKPLLEEVLEERVASCGAAAPPLLVKLSPDLAAAQQEEIARVLMDLKIDGIVLTNTTLDRPAVLPPPLAAHKGGLSGPLLRNKSTEWIRAFYALTAGSIPIVGAGGVSGPQDAYEKIRAGASLVQLYSALVFGGPAVVRKINEGLLDLMRRDGFGYIAQAVGTGHRDIAGNHDRKLA